MRTTTILLLLCAVFTCTAATYTSSGNKSWNASGFPDPVEVTDTVYVINGHTVTLNSDIDFEGFVSVGAGSQIIGNRRISVESTGNLTNNGVVNIEKDMHNDGQIFNSGFIYTQELHSDGYIFNSGQIKLEDNHDFKHHGGELEGCGTILADRIDISKNTGVSLNGIAAALTTCQNFCNVANTDTPTFSGNVTLYEFLNDTDSANSITDSIIAICFSGYLSVEYVEFSIENIQNKIVKISWSTSSEYNNALFEVERSIDKENWEVIDQKEAAGNSSSIRNYTTVDVDPIEGQSYYRIKQTDFDGVNGYSNILEVEISEKASSNIAAYPQPAHNMITLKSEKKFVKEDLEILSMTGEDLSGNIVVKESGASNVIRLDISGLKPGIYFVSYQGKQVRFVKQ
ncbi:T9SS type A sorting domain-containing protein [bacterium]|nr:T9SS type A sorting domain-containing protein [bacterium]